MKRLLFSSSMLLSILACGSAEAAPRERDAWYVHTADGVRYGSLHIQVARQADGNYRLTRQFRMLVDVLGANRETLTSHGEYVVTPDYRPVSFSVESERSSGKSRVSGQIEGNSFVIHSSRGGIDRTTTLEPTVILEPFLEDWLADRPADVRSGHVDLFDDEADHVVSAAIERLAGPETETAWSVDRGELLDKQRIVLGADGIKTRSSSEDVASELKLCTADEARDLTYRKLDGPQLLMFPIEKNLGDPGRLEALTVELRWKEIPLDCFGLTDERQHVVEQSNEGGMGRAVVAITTPEPVKDSVRFPVTGDEFAPYLAESRFIEPRDPKIIEAARGIVAGKANALEAVKALAQWTSTNVEPQMIAETLSGSEVLACRKGKCSEYTTLFASLARSAGIPTRIVLGERLLGDRWGGHMWIEAYVGRWITVDPGYGEVGTSFSLLKFVDSPTVEGTQPLRRRLPASLAVEVKDFRQRPAPLAGKFKTGVQGLVYTNAELACRMTAPGEDWSIEEKPEGGTAIVRFKVPNRDDAQLHFVAFSLPIALKPKFLFVPRITNYKSRMKGFEIKVEQNCLVGGLDGQRLQFLHQTDNGTARRAIEVIWTRGTAGFLLALDADDRDYEALEQNFTKLLDSFTDLSPN